MMFHKEDQLTADHQTILHQMEDFIQAIDDDVVKQSHHLKCVPYEQFQQIFTLGYFDLLLADDTASAITFLEGLRMLSQVFPSLASMVLTHGIYGILPIKYFGTAEQKATLLMDLITGEKLAAYALSEKRYGSDSQMIQTTATKTPNGWRLNGHKHYVSHGNLADYIYVYAQLDAHGVDKEYGIFIVDTKQKGVTLSEPIDKTGLRGLPVARLDLNEVAVLPADLLGNDLDGFDQSHTIMQQMKLAIAVQSIGVAESAFTFSLDELKRYRKFGNQLIASEDIQQKVANLYGKLDAIKTFVEATVEYQRDDARQIATAKLLASEIAVDLTEEVMHLTGGFQLMKGTPIEIFYQDAQFITRYGGSSETQRRIIASEWL